MILSEEELHLSNHQIKLIKAGWGEKVINDVKVKKIIYDSDGINVEGYLAYPNIASEKYPLIIWNRGGYGKAGIIDGFLAKGMYGEIASWGFVVLASQYRKADEFGGNDVNDILNLIPLGKTISFCDSDRIGMEGWSRGGMMSYLVLSKTEKIKCAIVVSGLADLFRNEWSKSNLTRVHKKLFDDMDESVFIQERKKRSAVYFADKINKDTNVLLIHGTADKKVSYQDSGDMYEKLRLYGVPCELKLIEGGDHYLRKQRKEISRIRRDWFNKYLKGAWL